MNQTMKTPVEIVGRLMVGCVFACCLTSKLYAQSTTRPQLPPPPPPPPNSAAWSATSQSRPTSAAWTTSSPQAAPSYFSPADYGTNLWIEFNGFVDYYGPCVSLTVHNTTDALYYQIFQKNDLGNRDWIPQGWMRGSSGTNQTIFSTMSIVFYYESGLTQGFWTNSNEMFFMPCGAAQMVGFNPGGVMTATLPSATNMSGLNATTYIERFRYLGNQSAPLTVNYEISGPAIMGVDYSNLSGTATIPAGAYNSSPIVIAPLYKTNAIFDNVSVTLWLTPTNGYLVEPGQYFATVIISNSIPITVVTNLPTGPYAAGIDYHPTQNALVLSVNDPNGQPNNFMLVGTNENGDLTLMTNWSNVAGAPDEVELTTVKTTTNGFVQGEMYFGNGKYVDKLSADGSQWVSNWCTLGGTIAERNNSDISGICVDDTGRFDHNLIVSSVVGSIWVVQCVTNGIASSTFLTNVYGFNWASPVGVGGIITLTNDVAKWGPWAGKILLGDPTRKLIYTVETNGAVVAYNTEFAGGIAAEDLAIIPPDQDLYFIDTWFNNLLKISRSDLAPYVGDLIITQTATGGDPYDGFSPPPELFIVAWNPTNSTFMTHIIPSEGILEDETFAPLNLPSQ